SRIGEGGSRTSRTAVEGYGVPRGASPYWVQGRCARSVGRCRRGLPLVDRSELLYAPCSARFEGCTIAEVLKRQRRITPRGKLRARPCSGSSALLYEPRPASAMQPNPPVSFTGYVRPPCGRAAWMSSSDESM